MHHRMMLTVMKTLDGPIFSQQACIVDHACALHTHYGAVVVNFTNLLLSHFFTHSLTHSLIHSPTHSLIHSLTLSLTHALILCVTT